MNSFSGNGGNLASARAEMQKEILEYLVDAKELARMRCDYLTVIKLSRAIAAFEAPVTKEIFTEVYKKEYHDEHYKEDKK